MTNLRLTLPAAAVLLTLASGCSTLRQVSALQQVHFDIDRIADVRVAGVSVDARRNLSDLSFVEAGRLAAAVARREIPLGFTLHIAGENPADNQVTARMLRMAWTLYLDGQATISGSLDTTYTFPPGTAVDVRLPVQLDLYQFFRTNALEALDIARGLMGESTRPTVVEVRAVPSIDTPVGPINYPGSITIARRTVGGP